MSKSLSESDIAKFVASSYQETSVSTLDITLLTFLSRRRRSEDNNMKMNASKCHLFVSGNAVCEMS